MPQILAISVGQFHKLLSPLKKEEDDHDRNNSVQFCYWFTSWFKLSRPIILQRHNKRTK